MKKLFLQCLAASAVFALSSCFYIDNPVSPGSGTTGTVTVAGIPSDDVATPNPAVTVPNITIPGLNYTVEVVNGINVIHFSMNGIQDPNNLAEWLRLYGTATSNQNFWISIDDKPKGVCVINTIDEVTDKNPQVDLVFLVDNSGSMSEEANAIARDIIDWASSLSSTLDIKFGCVGYDGAITGALDITDVNELSNYLNRSYGTYRTVGFEGDNASDLQSAVAPYATGGSSWNECGVAALRFAKDNFNYRAGANRIYVNFTDEYNQPYGNTEYSVEWVQNNWTPTDGTIHTVYSNGSWTEVQYYQEKPWLISDYTGGTTLQTNSSFTGISLSDLPVTGALQNSYVFNITNVQSLFDGQPHTVTITIYNPDGSVQGVSVFDIVFDQQ